MTYPSWSHSDGFSDSKGDWVQLSPTGAHTVTVDPRRSMRAATDELDAALEHLGADLDPAERRRTGLLASELVAQVAGRGLDRDMESVHLGFAFNRRNVHLETLGLSMASIDGGFGPEEGDVTARWGEFLLNRVADRWGIQVDGPPVLWAEVDVV